MSRPPRLILGTLALGILLAPASLAVARDTAEDTALLVGTREAAPFSFRDGDGAWRGITIALWARVAERLGLDYELREADLDELVEGVAAGRLDAGVAAVTVTRAREEVVDFSHPFFTAGVGIAAAARPPGWKSTLRAFVSLPFLGAVGVLFVVILVAGFLVWVFERRRNADQFGGTAHQGIGAGFWWSAVTMTTVGYGDKAPRTTGGRVVALVWMFVSLVIVSSLTAAIASALTVNSLDTGVSGPEDLGGSVVGTVSGTAVVDLLDRRRIDHVGFDTVRGALEALAGGELDAVVYDRPILQYLVSTDFRRSITVLPHELSIEHYAIVLPPGSPLREAVNREILDLTQGAPWDELVRAYLGR